MKPLFYISLGYLTLTLLAGCNHSNQLYQANPLYTFGTIVEISIWGVPEPTARQAVNAITADFETMHRTWHAWQPSALTELNQALAKGEARVITDRSLLSLIEQSKFFAKRSEGLFNPAIGQLIALWGFQSDEVPAGPPPTSEELAKWVRLAPSMEDVVIDQNRVSSSNPAVQLDFGAIAKGYAVDLAIDKLRQLGIQNAIVNAGGNLKAMGKKGDRPWSIGIRHPSGQGVLAHVEVSGEESVITSGCYERFREYQGVRYCHILDPRTGKPVTDLVSVTVIACSGSLADAASTALMVAGKQEWQRVANQMGVKLVMVVDDTRKVSMTPEMEERVVLIW